MVRDLTVRVENKPAALQGLGEATARLGAGIQGVCGTVAVGTRTFHLLVDDDKVADLQDALRAVGLVGEVERQVLIVDMDVPASFGNAAARLGREGVNGDLAYLATGDRLVIGVDDIDAGSAALRTGGN